MPFRIPVTLTTALVIVTSSFAQDITTIQEAHRNYYFGQYSRSLALYMRLADEGDAEAAERAGFMLLQGSVMYGPNVQRDPDLAKKLLLQAARSGRAGASLIVGLLDGTD